MKPTPDTTDVDIASPDMLDRATPDELDWESPIEWTPVDGLDHEAASAQEVNDLSDYIRRRKREDARYRDAADSGFYLCVTFPTARHRKAFTDALNLADDWHHGGITIAEALGLEIEWPT